jgi:hypothetical protein
MLKKIVITTTLLVSLVNAEGSELSYGLGLGALYNGVGINLSAIEKDEIKYVSLGCTAVTDSSYNGLDSSCGLGLGYINANILGNTNQHGIGVHISANNNTIENTIEFSIGLGYTYFVDESKVGLNFGVTPLLTILDKEQTDVSLLLGLGYQF